MVGGKSSTHPEYHTPRALSLTSTKVQSHELSQRRRSATHGTRVKAEEVRKLLSFDRLFHEHVPKPSLSTVTVCPSEEVRKLLSFDRLFHEHIPKPSLSTVTVCPSEEVRKLLSFDRLFHEHVPKPSLSTVTVCPSEEVRKLLSFDRLFHEHVPKPSLSTVTVCPSEEVRKLLSFDRLFHEHVPKPSLSTVTVCPSEEVRKLLSFDRLFHEHVPNLSLSTVTVCPSEEVANEDTTAPSGPTAVPTSLASAPPYFSIFRASLPTSPSGTPAMTPAAPQQQLAVDERSIPGMDRVDSLAEYLVGLRNETGQTLNSQQYHHSSVAEPSTV
ncbi:unnamed protein product [Leuciscus chuanchicus]